MDTIDINKVEKWKTLIKDLVKAKKNKDWVSFEEIKRDIEIIEGDVHHLFGLFNCDNKVKLMDSIVKAIDMSYNELNNPTIITSFQNFHYIFDWNNEQIALFNMLINDNQRNKFIALYYNSLYIEVDGFKFVTW